MTGTPAAAAPLLLFLPLLLPRLLLLLLRLLLEMTDGGSLWRGCQPLSQSGNTTPSPPGQLLWGYT